MLPHEIRLVKINHLTPQKETSNYRLSVIQWADNIEVIIAVLHER